MQRIVELKENGYADKDSFDYAPEDYADAIDSYNRVLEVAGDITANTIPLFYVFKNLLDNVFLFTFVTEKEVVMPQKSWSKAEEYIFSFLCIKQYVVPSLTVEEFLDFAQKSLPRLSKSSLKAKLSNVKHLLDSQKISNTIPLKPLRNFSKANEDAIKDLIESFKLR